MVDTTSICIFEYPVLLKGDREIRPKLHGAPSDLERCRREFKAQEAKH